MTHKKAALQPKKAIKNNLDFANQWTNFVSFDVEFYNALRQMIALARSERDLLETFNLRNWHDLIALRLTILAFLEDGRFEASVDTNVIRIYKDFYDAWNFILERERKIYKRLIDLLRIAKSEGLLLENVRIDEYNKAATDRIDQIDRMQKEKFTANIHI